MERYENPKPGPAPGRKLPSTQGSRNGFAVLTEQNVRDIRLRSEEGASNRVIAGVFGVNAATISRIISRKIWTHVD